LRNNDALLISALEHIHVGTGRSSGPVDLPVVRDPFGYPYIPASSLKGSLKSYLLRKNQCLENNSKNKKNPCQQSLDCNKVCCLLGGETEEEAGSSPSALTILDAYPLLYPVGSNEGISFITSKLLLERAKNFLDISIVEEGELSTFLASTTLKVTKICITFKNINLSELNPIYSIQSCGDGDNGVKAYVVSENDFTRSAERSMIRLTRVRLDRSGKTVVENSLWTEEYLPHTTLFVSAVVERGWYGEYCKNVKGEYIEILKEMSNEIFELYIGGKETIGKGLVRVMLVR